MDPNVFVTQLKTNEKPGDLTKVYNEYKAITANLPAKDKGPFSLNVLCTICRNLNKLPSWSKDVDSQSLLTLSIDCVRETRVLDQVDRVKTLASVSVIHRHAVAQKKPIPPELILKISMMPFELDAKHLLHEYHRTYFNILVDRLAYIERLKTKVNIGKLLPKLTEDIQKVISIYDTVLFCTQILLNVIKKLHSLFSETHAKELAQTFENIFTTLTTKDFKQMKIATEKDVLEIYIKLNECLYVVVENGSKIDFKGANLDVIVRSCISIVGHRPDLFHCLQTFYLNGFCSVLSNNTASYTESVLNGMLTSFTMTEKLGYKKALFCTYPFFNQFMNLYVDYIVINCNKRPWQDYFDMNVQEKCLEIIMFLMDKLKLCNQRLKCDNCPVKSGLHDSLRLSFLTKDFICVSISQKLVVTNISLLHTIIQKQYNILTELKDLGCVNYQKLFRKLQTDVHNTAITLNKSQYYEFAVKLFNIYLQYEFEYLRTQNDNDVKNISRALYNKSICELDSKLYTDAIVDAYLGQIISQDLTTDKYMTIVMDIKAKELKSKEDASETELQVFSILDACRKVVECNLYGGLQWFKSQVKLSAFLKHEFEMYAKLWPSIAPVGGVWRALLDLTQGGTTHWLEDETQETYTQTLYSVILLTPAVVRSLQSPHYSTVISALIEQFDNSSMCGNSTVDTKLMYITLLFLQFEYDMAEASDKYNWKTETVPSMDPDLMSSTRTLYREHVVSKRAILAVKLLRELMPEIKQASRSYLVPALKIYELFVPQLLHLYRMKAGLQLAYICSRMANLVGDNVIFLRNYGTLLYNGVVPNLHPDCGDKCDFSGVSRDTLAVFMCDVAIYYAKMGETGEAARLLQHAQAIIIDTMDKQPDINLDLPIGRCMEAHVSLKATNPSALAVVNNAQRHYLATSTHGTNYLTRRLTTSTIRLHTTLSSLNTTELCRHLRLRRGRAAAAAGLVAASAAGRAGLYVDIVDVYACEDAQFKIGSRLKDLINLQPSIETRVQITNELKHPPLTPRKELETMLDNRVFRKTQTSPTNCQLVESFKIPEFLLHPATCDCFACEIPIFFVLLCKITSLEASMYFRANEMEIAKNYFEGALKMFSLTEGKLKKLEKKYDDFIEDCVSSMLVKELGKAQIEMLLESAFFEMKMGNFGLVDEYIVKIHEIMEDLGDLNPYLENEVMNLMVASAQLKNVVKKPQEIPLEEEFESLNINTCAVTPISKGKMPEPFTRMVVKDEEIPKKLKVCKINLDESSDEECEEEPKTRSPEFKLPMPSTKLVLEEATPRPSRRILSRRAVIDDSNMATNMGKDGPNVTQKSGSNMATLKPSKDSSKSERKSEKDGSNMATSDKDSNIKTLKPVKGDLNMATGKITQKSVKDDSSTCKSVKETLNMATLKPTKDGNSKTEDVFATPMKPKLTITTPSCESDDEFFTPLQTPQFLTPMSNIRTYKKTLRKNIVKNLEQEFLTPKTVEKVSNIKSVGSSSVVVKSDRKRSLKRATSPGKLVKEMPKESPRPRRLRQPVKLSLDEN